jgi:hypothetical protein
VFLNGSRLEQGGNASGPLRLDPDVEYFESEEDADLDRLFDSDKASGQPVKRASSPPPPLQTLTSFRPNSPSPVIANAAASPERIARTPPARQVDPFSFDDDEGATVSASSCVSSVAPLIVHVGSTVDRNSSSGGTHDVSGMPRPTTASTTPLLSTDIKAAQKRDDVFFESASDCASRGTSVVPKPFAGSVLWTAPVPNVEVDPWSDGSSPPTHVPAFNFTVMATAQSEEQGFNSTPLLGPSAAKRPKLAVLLRAHSASVSEVALSAPAEVSSASESQAVSSPLFASSETLVDSSTSRSDNKQAEGGGIADDISGTCSASGGWLIVDAL